MAGLGGGEGGARDACGRLVPTMHCSAADTTRGASGAGRGGGEGNGSWGGVGRGAPVLHKAVRQASSSSSREDRIAACIFRDGFQNVCHYSG